MVADENTCENAITFSADLSRLSARVLFPGGERPASTDAAAENGAVACVPLARTRPSARGFGVDVRQRTRKREEGSVAQFSHLSPKRLVLFWCCARI